MNETYVSKTVSMKLEQVQWLNKNYGNVTKGIQKIVNEKMENKKNENLQK